MHPELRHQSWSFVEENRVSSFSLEHFHPPFSCDFRSDDSVNEMCDVFVLALRWYCRLLSDIFTARREHGIQLAKLIAGHVQVFENDHFARYVAFCVSFVDQGSLLLEVNYASFRHLSAATRGDDNNL